MPVATVPKKLLNRQATKNVGIAANKKKLSGFRVSFPSWQSNPGASKAARTVVGTKFNQRVIHGDRVRPERNSMGNSRGRYVTAPMPHIVRKASFSSTVQLQHQWWRQQSLLL